MLFVVLCPGTPEGSSGSGSGFKASQKTGQRLKVSSDRLGEAGNRTCDPWFTRHRFIPYTTAASQYLKNLKILTVSHNSFRMAVVYVLMYFKCKICFTVYTGETKINDTYLLTMNFFEIFYFLFKSFVKVELSYVFTVNLFTIAENCTEK